METPKISRSGRVCKKSSKLMDFRSPDEIETKISKKSMLKGMKGPGHLKMKIDTSMLGDPDFDSSESGTEDPIDSNDDSDPSMDDDDDINPSALAPYDEDDDDDLLVESVQKKSIYMTEKSTKKKMLKDGKIVMGKQQRKDAGKPRYTAYMLWAKDVRQQMLNSNPDLDFASVSKRLSEMWANVPGNQKFNWKRRARRLASTIKNSKAKGKPLTTNINSKQFVQTYLNKGQGIVKDTKKPKKEETLTKKTPQKIAASPKKQSSLESPIRNGGGREKTSITPMDIAAHLSILGDSLEIIGSRLKEHEGQIAVSGSLSVLLDSLLCSISPLMCLTTHIPQLRSCTSTRDQFQQTLDNIAYIMPGQ